MEPFEVSGALQAISSSALLTLATRRTLPRCSRPSLLVGPFMGPVNDWAIFRRSHLAKKIEDIESRDMGLQSFVCSFLFSAWM